MARSRNALSVLIQKLRDEQTMSGNVGGFAVPIGRPLRQKFPCKAGESCPPEGADLDLPVVGEVSAKSAASKQAVRTGKSRQSR